MWEKFDRLMETKGGRAVVAGVVLLVGLAITFGATLGGAFLAKAIPPSASSPMSPTAARDVAPSSFVPEVTVTHLLEAPERYQGRKVKVTGFALGQAIYPGRQDLDPSQGILVDAKMSPEYDWEKVVLQGIFHVATPRVGFAAGYLDYVQSIERVGPIP